MTQILFQFLALRTESSNGIVWTFSCRNPFYGYFYLTAEIYEHQPPLYLMSSEEHGFFFSRKPATESFLYLVEFVNVLRMFAFPIFIKMYVELVQDYVHVMGWPHFRGQFLVHVVVLQTINFLNVLWKLFKNKHFGEFTINMYMVAFYCLAMLGLEQYSPELR